MSNGSERMHEKLTVWSYSNIDEKIYRYKFEEEVLQKIAKGFHDDIFFLLTDDEAELLTEVVDNLKQDFMYYNPVINGASWWQCTCDHFLESDRQGVDRMLKKCVAHTRKTGHVINPRGN